MNSDRGAQSTEEWNRDAAPVSAMLADIREMAEHGNAAAKVVVKIDDALRAKKHAERWGEEVPAWARSTLSFLDEYQSDDDTESAIAALSAALR